MARKQKLFVEATPLIDKHLSGVGQVVLETVRALDSDAYKDTHDITIFVPINEMEKMKKYSFRNIKVVALPIPHKFLSLFSRFPIGMPLDLLLGKGVYVFPNFRNWTLAFSKSMTYIHDACFAIYPEYVQPRNLAYLRRYIGLWKKRTNQIIAVSDTTKKEVSQYLNIPKKNITVVKNAINATFYSPQSTKRVAEVKKKYDLKNYFLFIGNIEPRKNLTTLIDAFEKARFKQPMTLFIIGGDGWLNEAVYEKIAHARSLGLDVRKNDKYVPDEDLPALLTGAKALVLPSWHEGFGLPALQAVSCGTVALMADVPGLRELATDYKAPMEFFDPHNSNELADLITQYAGKKNSVRPIVFDRTWQTAADELLTAAAKLERSRV